MENKRFVPLAPPPPQSQDEIKGVTQTVQQLKAYVETMYPEVTFLSDSERSGYTVIRFKDIQTQCHTTYMQLDIKEAFGIDVMISVNNMQAGQPVIEIAVPRMIQFGFKDKYTRAQQVRLFLGVSAVLLSVGFLYLTVFHAPNSV